MKLSHNGELIFSDVAPSLVLVSFVEANWHQIVTVMMLCCLDQFLLITNQLRIHRLEDFSLSMWNIFMDS